MTRTTRTDRLAAFGTNRPTLLFLAWLFVGCSFVWLAVSGSTGGRLATWLLLPAGLLVVADVGREWFFRAGGDFADRTDDPVYIAVTIWVLAVTFGLLAYQLVT